MHSPQMRYKYNDQCTRKPAKPTALRYAPAASDRCRRSRICTMLNSCYSTVDVGHLISFNCSLGRREEQCRCPPRPLHITGERHLARLRSDRAASLPRSRSTLAKTLPSVGDAGSQRHLEVFTISSMLSRAYHAYGSFLDPSGLGMSDVRKGTHQKRNTQ